MLIQLHQVQQQYVSVRCLWVMWSISTWHTCLFFYCNTHCYCNAGTFLPPLSWPLVAACVWLALLHLRPRLDATDKRQACAGLLSCAMLLLFLLQDGEFTGWGESDGECLEVCYESMRLAVT